MTTRPAFDFPGAALVVEGTGFEIEVERTPPHEVCLTVEYDDPSWGSPHRTSEQYVSIDPEDWDAIVAYVAAERVRITGRPADDSGAIGGQKRTESQ